MITKEDLEEYSRLRREGEALRDEMQELEAAMTAAGVQKITGMPMCHTSDNMQLIDLISRMDALRKDYEALLAAVVSKQKNIEAALRSLAADERAVIRYRYFKGFGWRRICEEMKYSKRTVLYRHADALAKLSVVG